MLRSEQTSIFETKLNNIIVLQDPQGVDGTKRKQLCI